MRKRFALAGVLNTALFCGAAAGKPPEGPQPTKVNGEVPSPLVQEFFQEPAEPKAEVPPTVAPKRPLPVVNGKRQPVACTRPTGKTSAAPAEAAQTPVENLERLTKAEQFFRLGEALREAGELKMAAGAYEEAQRTAPGSRYAEQAAERSQRLAASAGVEDSQVQAGEAPADRYRFQYGPFRLEIARRSVSLAVTINLPDEGAAPAPK